MGINPPWIHAPLPNKRDKHLGISDCCQQNSEKQPTTTLVKFGEVVLTEFRKLFSNANPSEVTFTSANPS